MTFGLKAILVSCNQLIWQLKLAMSMPNNNYSS